jgi:uncharacterized membrane protein
MTTSTRTSRPIQLVAIGYGDAVTAGVAMDELDRLGADFPFRRDEAATISRDEAGTFRVETHAVVTEEARSWTMLWLTLFTALFFVPMLRMPMGADLAEIVRDIERAGLDAEFIERVRGMVVPGSSALFVLVEHTTPDDLVSALEDFGGTVLQCEIPPPAEETVRGSHLVA